MAVSSNGYDVACGHYNGDDKSADSGILIWNAKKNQQRTSWPGAEPADGLAFSPDGKTLAFPGVEDNSVQSWDIASHRMTIALHTSPIAYPR
jgi:WD40 repeat protein